MFVVDRHAHLDGIVGRRVRAHGMVLDERSDEFVMCILGGIRIRVLEPIFGTRDDHLGIVETQAPGLPSIFGEIAFGARRIPVGRIVQDLGVKNIP